MAQLFSLGRETQKQTTNTIMIAIIAFIFLWVRMVRFGKLTVAELPGATEDDIQQIRSASKTAFFFMLLCMILSFLPAGFVGSPPQVNDAYWTNERIQEYNSKVVTANVCSWVFSLVGVLVSSIFDTKAHKIRKRFLVKQPIKKTDEKPPAA